MKIKRWCGLAAVVVVVAVVTGGLWAQTRTPRRTTSRPATPTPVPAPTPLAPPLTPTAIPPAVTPENSTPRPDVVVDVRRTAAPAAPQRISLWDAAILGVVEGVTEYLPVSSTGHLILAAKWLGLSDAQRVVTPGNEADKSAQMKSEAVDSFEIVIQFGAILAVVGLYRKRCGQMIRGLSGKSDAGKHIFIMLVLAFLPAGVTGLLFHKKIEEHLFNAPCVIAALAVGGVLMIVAQWYWRKKRLARIRSVEYMNYGQALVIGLAQCLAMWPGTSRSMITMVAGMLVGLDIMVAAEFSFLLALPTLGAATLYSAWKHHDALMQFAGPGAMTIGLIVSCVVAAIAVKSFVRWLTGHGLAPFGVYRILLAGGYVAAVLMGLF